MTVKRYVLGGIYDCTPPGFHEYVAAGHYDASQARLAEAEALLRESVDVTMNWDGIADRIDAFLRPTNRESGVTP